MAVAFDANASAVVTGTGVTALNSSNLTVGAGSNRAVVAQLVLSLKTAASVTVNWDNAGTPQSQTLIVSANGTGTIARAELWGLVNPTSGAKQARAAWTGASDAYINCTSFTGVDQTGGTTTFPNSTSGTGTRAGATPFSLSITSATGNMTVADIALDIGSLSTPTQTQTFLSNALACDGAGSRAVGAASVAHAWNGDTNGSHWVIVGTDILASGGGVTVALTNAAATFSAGTLTHNADVALANSAATFSAGTAVPTLTLALTNALASFSAGTVTPSTTIPLTNALGTFSAGTVTVTGDLTLALTSALGTFSATSLTPSSTLAITNALGTFSAGTATPASTVALSNAAGTFSATSLTPSSSVSLANALGIWTAGDVGIQGDVTIALTGAQATWSAGTLTVSASGSAETFSGGYFPYTKRRTPEDIRRSRIEFGVLPPDEEQKAEEAVEEIVEATVALANADPETQAATDALEAQQRAEERFIAVYSSVFPALQKAQILETLRQEAEYKAAMMEEEAFVISLLF